FWSLSPSSVTSGRPVLSFLGGFLLTFIDYGPHFEDHRVMSFSLPLPPSGLNSIPNSIFFFSSFLINLRSKNGSISTFSNFSTNCHFDMLYVGFDGVEYEKFKTYKIKIKQYVLVIILLKVNVLIILLK
ncbi:hypothetical protein L9F63_004430, partial [Diploptera punctata]